MPWSVRWLDEEEDVVVFEVDGTWTWNEYVDIVTQAQAMIRTRDHTVHTIYNLSSKIKIPYGNSLVYFQKVYSADPPNSGLIIAVGANSFIETLVNIITRIMGGAERFRFVPTMDAALEEVARIRAERSAV